MDLETIERKLKWSLLATASIAGIAVVFYFGWFGIWLGEPLSKTTATWGELGDFVGGLMNPIVAGCALYWLAMSVGLQKQELSDTRKELAAASQAQQEQARMALLGIQLNSISTQLNAITTELEYVQGRMSYILQRLDAYDGVGQPHIFDLEAGGRVPARTLAASAEKRMNFLQTKQLALLKQLDQVNKLASAKQREPDDAPPARS